MIPFYLDYFNVITISFEEFHSAGLLSLFMGALMYVLIGVMIYFRQGSEYEFRRNTFIFEQRMFHYLYKADPLERFDLIDIEKIEKYHNYSLGPVLLKVYTHRNIYYISNDDIMGALIYRLTEEEDREKLFEDTKIKDSVNKASLLRAKEGKTVKRRGGTRSGVLQHPVGALPIQKIKISPLLIPKSITIFRKIPDFPNESRNFL